MRDLVWYPRYLKSAKKQSDKKEKTWRKKLATVVTINSRRLLRSRHSPLAWHFSFRLVTLYCRHGILAYFMNGWWKVHAKSTPPAYPTTGPLIFIIFWKKRNIFDFTLLHQVLYKLHKYQIYLMISDFVVFFE